MQTPEKSDYYQYQSLPSHGWFRLLVLEAWTCPDYRISCRLFRERITSSKDYDALPYTWGTDEAIAPILINGQVHRVRYNLMRALQSLGLPDKKRFLWIDALCINQGSPDERADQVSQMGEIYSGARRVVVWLGEEQPDVPPMLRWIAWLKSPKGKVRLTRALATVFVEKKSIMPS